MEEEENMSEDNININNSQTQTQEEEETSNGSDDKNKYNDYSDGGGIIPTFCQMEGNEFFVEISEEFLKNKFNLFGIPKHFKHFR